MASAAFRTLVFAAALAAALTAQARLPAEVEHALSDSRPVPKPELARIAALSFDELLADYYWLRAVQVVGATNGDPSEFTGLVAQLSELVVALDPWVGHPYRFAAIWLSDDPKTLPAVNRIVERGIAYHPLDWRNRFYLAFNLFFHMGENQRAADELDRALQLEGAPRYMGRLVARLRAADGDLEAAAGFLSALLADDPDPYKRAEYEKALDEIETERRARRLDAARETYRERHGRDIASVEDLAHGPAPVLAALPEELHGWKWAIDAQTGAIVSSYYGRRYQVNYQDEQARARERMQEGVAQ